MSKTKRARARIKGSVRRHETAGWIVLGVLGAFWALSLLFAGIADINGEEDIEVVRVDALNTRPAQAWVDGAPKQREDGSWRIDGSADIDYWPWVAGTVVLLFGTGYMLRIKSTDADHQELLASFHPSGDVALAKKVFLNAGAPTRWANANIDVQDMWIGGIGVLVDTIAQIESLQPRIPKYCSDVTGTALYNLKALNTTLREDYDYLAPVVKISGWNGTKSIRVMTEKMASEVNAAIELRDSICELYAKGRISRAHGEILKSEVQRALDRVKALEELDDVVELEAPKDDASRSLSRIREDPSHPITKVYGNDISWWDDVAGYLDAHPEESIPTTVGEFTVVLGKAHAVRRARETKQDLIAKLARTERLPNEVIRVMGQEIEAYEAALEQEQERKRKGIPHVKRVDPYCAKLFDQFGP